MILQDGTVLEGYFQDNEFVGPLAPQEELPDEDIIEDDVPAVEESDKKTEAEEIIEEEDIPQPYPSEKKTE